MTKFYEDLEEVQKLALERMKARLVMAAGGLRGINTEEINTLLKVATEIDAIKHDGKE